MYIHLDMQINITIFRRYKKAKSDCLGYDLLKNRYRLKILMLR